jgi:hypothetical protein
MAKIEASDKHQSSRKQEHRESVANLPRPTTPLISLPAALVTGRLLRPNRLWYAFSVWLEATPWAYRAFTFVEKHVKQRLFGCRMCAQCALPSTAYACPMSCPKQLRNGPCGGVHANGGCEVYPELRCVWVVAYERAAAEGRTNDLRRLQRPIDQREWGMSSWVNYWQHRDDGLWTSDVSFADAPQIGQR